MTFEQGFAAGVLAITLTWGALYAWVMGAVPLPSQFKLYRRWKGGHWEQCWIDLPGCMYSLWFQQRHDAPRPHHEHLEACEDW